MTGNSDPRARRARQALIEAFESKVVDHGLEEMTVSALCRAAGVTRSTFYQHFASPDELALESLGALFDHLRDADIVLRSAGSKVTPAEASRHAIAGIVGLVGGHRTLYARLLGPTAPPRLRTAVTTAFAEHSVEPLTRMSVRPAGVDPRTVADYLAGGVLAVLGSWLANPDDSARTADHVVEEILLCLPAWLMGAHDRSS